MHDEFEEHVFARDVEIALHLIAMISTPIASLRTSSSMGRAIVSAFLKAAS